MTILDDVRLLGPLLRSQSPAAESARRLTPEAVEALVPTGAFRMFVPACYDGPEVDPLTAIEVVASLAEHDAATGWCVGIASMTSHLAGVLEPAWAREVFADPSAIACGAFAPNGIGRSVDGGHRVDGRWGWGSGSQFSSWLTAGTVTDDGDFHQMIVPTSEVEIIDTWNSIGLRGSGSHDFAVRDAFVPLGRSVVPGKSRPQVDAPIARVSMFVLFAGGVAAVMIGIARRAISEFIELSAVKKPAQSSRTLGSTAAAHAELARAEATVRASHAYLVHESAQAWDVITRGDKLTVDDRVRVRLAAAHVGAECCRAVDALFAAAAGSAVAQDSPLGRCFRDVHTAAAHIMVSGRAFETAGRFRFGLDIEASSL